MATSFSNFKNRAQTTLSQAVTSTESIWTLVDAAEMPASVPFYITCEDEIVKATSLNTGSNQVCVTRGQDNTTAAAHSRFDSVEQRIVKIMFTEIHGSVNSLEDQVSSFNVASIGAQIGSFYVSSLDSRVDSIEDQLGAYYISSLWNFVGSTFCGSVDARVDSVEDQLSTFYISSLWNFVGSTFCGSHTVETQSIHGVAGDILGTTDVQSITNKWVYDCQFRFAVATITGSYTITNSDHILFVNPSTPITINLTEATADTAGRPLQIKQVVTSFAIVVQPYAAQHIDAASDYTLTDINKYLDLIDCGSGWNILGSN